MPGETWQCAFCHKNNTIGVSTCVTCGREAGDVKPASARRRAPTKPAAMTATEREKAVRAAGDPEPAVQTKPATAGRVRFSGRTAAESSKERSRTKSGGSRAARVEFPPTPPGGVPVSPRISTAPPPVRSGAPTPMSTPAAPSRRGAGTGRLVKLGAWAILIFAGWQFGLPLAEEFIAAQSSSTSAASPGQTGTMQPCPPEVAAFLPGQTGTLVVRYQTVKHMITVCQATDGQLFYDGQVKEQAASSDTHISLPAQPIGDGYIAHNGAYTYQITGGRIVVTNAGKVVLDEVLQPT